MTFSRSASTSAISLLPFSSASVAPGRSVPTMANSSMTLASIASS